MTVTAQKVVALFTAIDNMSQADRDLLHDALYERMVEDFGDIDESGNVSYMFEALDSVLDFLAPHVIPST